MPSVKLFSYLFILVTSTFIVIIMHFISRNWPIKHRETHRRKTNTKTLKLQTADYIDYRRTTLRQSYEKISK